jgi:serine phosphatase RsbU (regulator of sigma subunit)
MISSGPGAGDAHGLRCMEIWGGSQAVEQSVTTPGLDVWICSQPYKGATGGGDVHYVSLCGGGVITRLILADISGHGEAVSEVATALRNLVRRNINTKSQTRLVQALNRQFAELAQMRRFATAVVVTYLATTDRLTLCNAGHPRPLWYRAATGDWAVLSSEAPGAAAQPANLPLGLDEDTPYDQFSLALERGDYLLLYSDALTEAADPAGQLLGEPGLLNIVRSLDMRGPSEIGPDLLKAVRGYRGGHNPDDDLTLLTLRHTARPPRRPSLAEKIDVYAKVFGLKAV